VQLRAEREVLCRADEDLRDNPHRPDAECLSSVLIVFVFTSELTPPDCMLGSMVLNHAD
jgi:hypothetical protein